jgi:peptidoglycan/LPS O-acetylase OafA/YrhL
MKATQQVHIKSKHILQLDGLRGLAILLVLSFHYFVPLSGIFSLGWSGVDLFFVLSGFLITMRLLDTIDSRDYFSHFYRNRILRIFPLYYLTLILFFLAIYTLVKEEHLHNIAFYKLHWLSFFVFTQNWSLIFYGHPVDTYITHFWSLAVEEQFYILWPFVLYFIRDRKKLFRIMLLALPLIIIVRSGIYIRHPEFNMHRHYYINTFCRMDSFIIGAIMCFIYRSEINVSNKTIYYLFYLFLLLLCAGIAISGNAFFANYFFSTIGYTILAVLYACLLYISIQTGNFFSAFFEIPFLRFCGKISYGIYIFHWPVRLIFGFKIYNWAIVHLPFSSSLTEFFSLALCVLLTFIVSIISFYYFESYFLRLKK